MKQINANPSILQKKPDDIQEKFANMQTFRMFGENFFGRARWKRTLKKILTLTKV